ncbi:hypothetical protein K8R32_04090 [bacterium]|nr:hypothetical protein [bacterium]
MTINILLHLVDILFNTGKFLQESNLQLLSIVANIVLIRIYFKNLKFEKTGKGLLVVTFAFILFFLIFKEISF